MPGAEDPDRHLEIHPLPPCERCRITGRGLQRSDAPPAAVWRLAEEGHDVVAIAKQLGIGKGEVELILELKKTS